MANKQIWRRKLLAALAGLAWAVPAARALVSPDSFVAMTEENDLLANPFGAHTDRHYTQGLRLTLMLGQNSFTNISGRLDRLVPALGFQSRANDLGLVLIAQHMYTPTDIRTTQPIPADRPYAAWLYSGLIWQRRGVTGASLPTLEHFADDFGMVGPLALGEQAQNLIHRWAFPSDVAKGWDNQIHDEPALQLRYSRLWKFAPEATAVRHFDFIPYAGAELGNVRLEGNLGAMVRLGSLLPDDFGVPIMDAPVSVTGWMPDDYPPFFGYLFGRIEGRAVGHDIFLDGNLFRNSPHIERNPFVADFAWGISLHFLRRVELCYTHVIRTLEFVGQRHADVFGSLTLKARITF